MGSPYRYTSGTMLHYADCMHFVDELPPREATPDELKFLPVCSTCARATSSAGSGPGSSDAGRFVCPSCHVSQPVAMRAAGGLCGDCA